MGNFIYQQLYKEDKFNEVFQGLKDQVLKSPNSVNPWDFYFFSASGIEIKAREITYHMIESYLNAKEGTDDQTIYQKALDRIEGLVFKLFKADLDKLTEFNTQQIRLLFQSFQAGINQVKRRKNSIPYYFYLDISMIEFLKVYLKNETNLDLDKPLFELVNSFDYSYFSSENFTSKNPKNQKDIVHASKQEKFFFLKAKLLMKLNRYQESIDYIKIAFSKVSSFHESIDISLKRLQAKAHLALGEYTQSIQLLNDLIIQKPEWYIYQEIGDAYAQANQKDLALMYFIKAYLIYIPEMSSKVNLIHRLGNAFTAINPDLSLTLYLQEIQLRKSKDWPISEELSAKTVNPPKILLKDLETHLLDYLYSKNQPQTGTVITILPNGKSGFIDQHYFSFKSFIGHPSKIKVGVKVDYLSSESKDKSGKQSKEAIHIRLSK
jgi:tetratricopeptide (TPR) repeat protein